MSAPPLDLRRKTLHGLWWQFLGVGGQRIVALVAPIVIAHTIAKEDVSLFLIVLTGIGVVESLTMFMGEQSTISSSRGAERRYLDTVFTVRVLRSLVISGLLCALAPLLAWFFSRPEYAERYWLTGLFLTLAGNGLIDGLQSPARAARLKGMEFRRVVLGDFVAAVLGTLCTVLFAWLWRDVWALLAGFLCGTAIRTLVSYASAPHRPQWRLEREALRELFHYSKGAAGTPFLLVAIFSSPAIALGRFGHDQGGLAVFDYAGRLARLPEDIFLRVLGPVAIPAYATLRHDLPRLTEAWLGALRSFLLVGVPMTVAMAWCGGALPGIVFGADYAEVDGLFALQSVHGGLAGLTAVVGPLFWAIGIPGRDRTAQLFRALTIYGLGIPLAIRFGVIGFAWAMVASIVVALALSLSAALRHLGIPLRRVLANGRDGALVGGLLLLALVAVEWFVPAAGWWRLSLAALLAGPVIAATGLSLLRQRRIGPPMAPSPADGDLPP
ncbi:MAG: oligosaccharide flippase family protein [Planctomycetes bacterium]|nr:oligosaccharide flippase family protein [Planctomycetota bacterium]